MQEAFRWLNKSRPTPKQSDILTSKMMATPLVPIVVPLDCLISKHLVGFIGLSELEFISFSIQSVLWFREQVNYLSFFVVSETF